MGAHTTRGGSLRLALRSCARDRAGCCPVYVPSRPGIVRNATEHKWKCYHDQQPSTRGCTSSTTVVSMRNVTFLVIALRNLWTALWMICNTLGWAAGPSCRPVVDISVMCVWVVLALPDRAGTMPVSVFFRLPTSWWHKITKLGTLTK